MRPEHPRPVLVAPQIELPAWLGATAGPALEVEDRRLPRQVLTRHRQARLHEPGVQPSRPVEPVGFAAQQHEPAPPHRRDLALHLGADASLTPDADAQLLGEVDVLAPSVGIEVVQHLETRVSHLDAYPRRQAHRPGEDAGRLGREVLAPPLRAEPHPHVVARRGAQRGAPHRPHAQHALLGRVRECAVAESQHAGARRLPVRGERPARRGLVEGQPQSPTPPVPVGEVPVVREEGRATPQEVRAAVQKLDGATIRGLPVLGVQLGRRAQQVLLDDADIPGRVAAGGREAGLGLGAPSIGGLDAERQAPVHPQRIDPHVAKHAQRAERPLALDGAGGVVGLPGVGEQRAADHAGPRRDVQRVREPRHERRPVAVPREHIVVDDDDGIDGLGGKADRRTGGQPQRRHPDDRPTARPPVRPI